MKKDIPASNPYAFFWVNAIQFLDTFNNNFLRTALASFVMFEMTTLAANTRSTLAALAVGLLMLPAFLVSALAGELADKYAKHCVIKGICLLQFSFVLLACIGFKRVVLPCLFIAVLGMGAGGSMLSPVKYSILPEILPSHKLLLANGLMQAAVYIAILGGTIVGGMIFSFPRTYLYIILMSIGIATAVCSLFVPCVAPANPQVHVDLNFLRSTYQNMHFAKDDKRILVCILSISWFWGVGTILLSQLPALVTYLGGNDAMFTLFLVLFSCGIGIGSLLSQLLLKGKISAKYSVISLLLTTVFLADLAYVTWNNAGLIFNTLPAFLHSLMGKRIAFDLLAFAICGGVYIVPLATLLQTISPIAQRARIIAANNIVNALFMVAGSLLCSGLLFFKQPIPRILGLFVILNSGVVIILYYKQKSQDL